MEVFNYKISPGVLKDDIFQVTYSGDTFGVYSGMSYVLSGDTGGTSFLTGLTLPILITQNYDDIGYYDPFDGLAVQQDVIDNFLTSGSSSSPYDVYLYNTSDASFKGFLTLSPYVIDWGDGSPTENITTFSPNYALHTYPSTPSGYTISLSQTNPWGATTIYKDVFLPISAVTIYNPLGIIQFSASSMGGVWTGTVPTYRYIFTGDSENNVISQGTNNYVSVPYSVSGYTKSRLTELKQYTAPQYNPGLNVYKNGELFGVYNGTGLVGDIVFSSYTINGVNFYDYPDGQTVFVASSSGITSNDLVASAITKNEAMMGIVEPPLIQSNVFIERGKNSAFEGLQRLGEVDSLGDLERYGYKFFKFSST